MKLKIYLFYNDVLFPGVTFINNKLGLKVTSSNSIDKNVT